MAANLPLPHKPQQGDGYCLPACAQMVLAYLGISRTQDALAKTLGLNPPFGTRHSNIKKLASAKIKVTYEAGDLATIRHWIEQGTPVIVFVQAGDLPHWSGQHFQHAVVVVGVEGQRVYLMDPALDEGSTPVEEEAFMLAWSWFDYYYATLIR
ncbi:MAG: C39 family peptidase [Anaerolineales bacterium]|nr:C39 family peptidase [Anaerolineales bacterium]